MNRPPTSTSDRPAPRRARGASTLGARLLAALAEVWPSPMAEADERLGAEAGTPEHQLAYARDQFMRKVWFGFGAYRALPPLWGKTVVEVGCGHGGISAYLASLGARRVVGIDLNTAHLRVGHELLAEIARESGKALPVHLAEMDAMRMALPDASVDVVICDNLFEHVIEPALLLREIRRVIRPSGKVLVPTFSSIESKYGLHLKRGLRVPWANLVFAEPTIVEAMKIRAGRHPELEAFYPGLTGAPVRVRDLRRHGDLNDITYARFRELASQEGFDVEFFRVQATLTGKVVRKVHPGIERTRVMDVLSTGATALLAPR